MMPDRELKRAVINLTDHVDELEHLGTLLLLARQQLDLDLDPEALTRRLEVLMGAYLEGASEVLTEMGLILHLELPKLLGRFEATDPRASTDAIASTNGKVHRQGVVIKP